MKSAVLNYPIEIEVTRDGAEIRVQGKVIGETRDDTVIDVLLMPGQDYDHERYTPPFGCSVCKRDRMCDLCAAFVRRFEP